MEGDPTNVAEAFPHAGFNSLVCAEMLPLDSGSVCSLEGEELLCSIWLPFGASALFNVPPSLVESHELPRLVRMHSFPGC